MFWPVFDTLSQFFEGGRHKEKETETADVGAIESWLLELGWPDNPDYVSVLSVQEPWVRLNNLCGFPPKKKHTSKSPKIYCRLISFPTAMNWVSFIFSPFRMEKITSHQGLTLIYGQGMCACEMWCWWLPTAAVEYQGHHFFPWSLPQRCTNILLDIAGKLVNNYSTPRPHFDCFRSEKMDCDPNEHKWLSYLLVTHP